MSTSKKCPECGSKVEPKFIRFHGDNKRKYIETASSHSFLHFGDSYVKSNVKRKEEHWLKKMEDLDRRRIRICEGRK